MVVVVLLTHWKEDYWYKDGIAPYSKGTFSDDVKHLREVYKGFGIYFKGKLPDGRRVDLTHLCPAFLLIKGVKYDKSAEKWPLRIVYEYLGKLSADSEMLLNQIRNLDRFRGRYTPLCFYLEDSEWEIIQRKLDIQLIPEEWESLVREEIVQEEDFRKRFPAGAFRTDDGHLVRSKGESLIDNWLYYHNIAHAYERRVPIEEEMYCDFYIRKGAIYIEYWGMEDKKYGERKEIKLDLYKKYSLNLVSLTDKDIFKLDDILPKLLRKYLPKDIRFE